MSAAAANRRLTANTAPISAEVHKFDVLAHEFWDPRGAFRSLHVLNPVRVDYMRRARSWLSGACWTSAAAAGC